MNFFIFLFNDRYTKPETFADCVGDELPLGWEQVLDPALGVYYIDHINREWFLLVCTCIDYQYSIVAF